jgi:hypothetical protein
MSLWFRAQISKTVVSVPVNSTAAIGITIQGSGKIRLLCRKLQSIVQSAACVFLKMIAGYSQTTRNKQRILSSLTNNRDNKDCRTVLWLPILVS